MEFLNMISFLSKYFIQANFILTFCIIVVLVIRFFVRNYSRAYSCCAWGIVCFGFVFYFSSPLQFPFRVVYSFLIERYGQRYSPVVNSAEYQGISSSTEAANDPSMSFLPESGEMLEPDFTHLVTELSSDFLQISCVWEQIEAFRFIQFLSYVWFAGLLILLIQFLYSYIRINRLTRFAINLKENIFELDGHIAPFVYGIFHVRIYIPYGLKEEEIDLIAAHEKCHIKYKHHLILLLAKSIRIIFWVNPFVWIAYRKLSLDIELFCDEYTTKKLGTSEKKKYSLLLVHLASTSKTANVICFSSGASILKKRIKSILQSKKRTITLPVCILILCFFVVAAGTTAYAEINSSLLSNLKNSDIYRKNNDVTIRQGDIERKLAAFNLQNSEINVVILDANGKIIAQKGNIHEKVIPGAAARSVIAADILADGKVKLDSMVKGNSIVCCNEEGEEEIYPNWRQESEEMTFSQALQDCSQIGLISAALNTDLSNLKNRLENQGFSSFDAASESSIASCIIGQGMDISLYHLADAYYSAFKEERNSQLRLLLKPDLEQYSQGYSVDPDISGSYGTGFRVLSGEPSVPGTVVKMSATAVYVGDCYLENQRIIIAVSQYFDEIVDNDVSGSNLVSVANALLLSEEVEGAPMK